MSILAKTILGLGVLAGLAALPAPASQISKAPVAAVVAPAVVPRALAMVQGADVDKDCFVARKKSAKKRAAQHVRLVRVCE